MFGLIICAAISGFVVFLLSLFDILSDYPFWVKIVPVSLVLLRFYNLLSLSAIKSVARGMVHKNPDLFSDEERIMLLSSPAIFITPILSSGRIGRNELAAQDGHIFFLSIIYLICSIVWYRGELHVVFMVITLIILLMAIPLHLGCAFYVEDRTWEKTGGRNLARVATNYARAKGENIKKISKDPILGTEAVGYLYSVFISTNRKIRDINDIRSSGLFEEGDARSYKTLEEMLDQPDGDPSEDVVIAPPPPTRKVPHWYYLAPDNTAVGPYFKTALLALIEDGTLTWDTYVWNGTSAEDGGKWVLARDSAVARARAPQQRLDQS